MGWLTTTEDRGVSLQRQHDSKIAARLDRMLNVTAPSSNGGSTTNAAMHIGFRHPVSSPRWQLLGGDGPPTCLG